MTTPNLATRCALMVLALTLLALKAQATAADDARLLIPVTVTRVYDGDTITAHAEIWPGQNVATGVRLNGIDTPEIRGRCDAERELAIKARDRLRELIAAASLVQIADPFHGRWAGRVVARVLVDGADAGAVLVSAGLAREYGGGRRESWCAGGDDAGN